MPLMRGLCLAALLCPSLAAAAARTSIPVAKVPIAYLTPASPDGPRDPAVRARIGGRSALLLLDTGAGGVWLDRGFVRDLGLAPVNVRLGAWEGKVDGAHAYAMPASLPRQGVRGIINPLRLTETGAAVLDFPSLTLLLLDQKPADLKAWLEKRYPSFEFEAFTRQIGFLPPANDPDKAFHTVVRGFVAGYPEGPLLIDSGAGGVRLRDNYMKRREGTKLGATTIRLGHHALTVDHAEVGPHRDGPDVIGSLGMSALRGLIIALPAASDKIFLGFPSNAQ